MALFNIGYQLISKLKKHKVAGGIAKAAATEGPTKAEFDALVTDYNNLVKALKDSKE